MKHATNDDKQKITFMLPRMLVERLRVSAERNRRSLVGELVWAVEQYLERQDAADERGRGKP